jgi:predicted ABC-type ATPase
MEAAKDARFHVRLEFISLSNAFQSAGRVAERVAKGGHDIPVDAIARRFDKIAENLPEATSIADETTIRDNAHKDFPSSCASATARRSNAPKIPQST